ncbi:MAG: uracil-DNA glycosylase family protein [Verrucomicrobiales bacterium]
MKNKPRDRAANRASSPTRGDVASEVADALLKAARELCAALRPLRFGAPVTHVYNPLEYAWEAHAAYVRRFATGQRRVVFLGMNPGPFGMTQTGVPFGEVEAVSGWMGIHAAVSRPIAEHARRPIEGFECRRSEVSGRRLWGWAAERFGPPEAFFSDCFVVNYCPLLFLEESGRNRTPDKIPAAEMDPVTRACDAHLAQVLQWLQPDWVLGVGGYAESRLRLVAPSSVRTARIGSILHPSPASPAANRGWAAAVDRQLAEMGVF